VPPKTNDLRIIFESFSSPVIRGRVGRGKAAKRVVENHDLELGDTTTEVSPLLASPV
jgi:hypothetical protein